MAQFMATIQGNRGEASRVGSRDSGIVAHINGWDFGITVAARHVNGKDLFDVYKTSGSHRRSAPTLIGTYSEEGDE